MNFLFILHERKKLLISIFFSTYFKTFMFGGWALLSLNKFVHEDGQPQYTNLLYIQTSWLFLISNLHLWSGESSSETENCILKIKKKYPLYFNCLIVWIHWQLWNDRASSWSARYIYWKKNKKTFILQCTFSYYGTSCAIWDSSCVLPFSNHLILQKFSARELSRHPTVCQY